MPSSHSPEQVDDSQDGSAEQPDIDENAGNSGDDQAMEESKGPNMAANSSDNANRDLSNQG